MTTLISMESKILMLNKMLYAHYENVITGKVISFTEKERKILDKKYSTYFGNGKWNGSVRTFYQDFLCAQQQEGIPIEIPDTSFDVYDLAAMAYIYKRIKETDPVREASHVVIDEAQDFGMMVYRCLHYCMRGCTYTVMGDTSQNIHFGQGLNDWEELRRLILREHTMHSDCFEKAIETRWKSQNLPRRSFGMEIFRYIRWNRSFATESR